MYEPSECLLVCDGFFCSLSVTYDGAVLLSYWQFKQAMCKCFLLWQEAIEVILDVWLYYIILEGERILELHRSVSVASGLSHHKYKQTAVRYSSKFLTKQKLIQVRQLLYMSGFYEWISNDAIQSSMSEQYWRHVH